MHDRPHSMADPSGPSSATQVLNTIDYGLVGAGLIVLSVFVVRTWLGRGRDPLRGAPIRRNRLAFLILTMLTCVMVLSLGYRVGAAIDAWTDPGDLPEQVREVRRGLLGTNAGFLLMIPVCLVIAHLVFPGGLRGFGLGRRAFGVDLRDTLPGLLVAFSLTTLVVLVTDFILRLLTPDFKPPEHAVFQALEHPATEPWLGVLVVGGAFILAPLAEELLFRGMLQSAVQKGLVLVMGGVPRTRIAWHRWFAVVIAAVVFGAGHLSVPHHIPALIALGLLLGFLYERTGSLVLPILIHMLFNGKSLLWYAWMAAG